MQIRIIWSNRGLNKQEPEVLFTQCIFPSNQETFLEIWFQIKSFFFVDNDTSIETAFQCFMQ